MAEKASQFDYKAAQSAGYSPAEITAFLQQQHPSFDAKAAQDAGYSPEEISTFLSNAPRKQEGLRGELERKVAAPVAELGLRAATSIPNAVQGLGSLVNRGLNAVVKGFGGKGLTDEQIEKSGKLAKSLTPFANFSEKSDLGRILKSATGGRLEPTTPTERVLKGGAGIVGDIVGFPGGVSAAVGTPARAAGTAALAGTTAGLEEAGANPWIALTGGIISDLATRGAIGGTKRAIAGLSGGVPKAAGNLAGHAAKLTPSQIKSEVIGAGDRLGISQGEIPINAQITSPMINGIETKLRESSLAGRHFEKQLGNVEKKTRTAFEDIANNISKRQGLLPGAVADEAISQLKNIEEHATSTYNSLYSQAESALPKTAAIEQGMGKVILNTVDDLVTKLGRGAGTPAKDALRSRLGRLATDWKQRFPNGEIGVRDLIELKKDLNQIIKYEVKGGVDKMLNPLNNITRNAIQRYGKTNQPFSFRFNEAERHFADSAKRFRKNDAVSSLLSTQNPQQILNKMRNVKTYRELRDLYGRTKEGKAAFDDLSRYLLEDMIGSKLLNKDGKVSWGRASGMLKDPKVREIVQEMISPQNYGKLKDIQKISSGIETGLKQFANPSGTATKSWDIALILGTIVKGMGEILTGRVIKGAKSMGYVVTPRIMARLMTNPEFIQSLTDSAHAGRGSNPQLFREAIQRSARFIIPAINESYPDDEPTDEEQRR